MSRIVLPPRYVPSDNETYMCPMHLEYFRQKLQERFDEITAYQNSQNALDLSYREQDQIDQSIIDNCNELELSHNNQRVQEYNDISQALKKITIKEYGYCEVTYEEIGLERLKANPTARYCIEVQRKIEEQNAIRGTYNHIDGKNYG